MTEKNYINRKYLSHYVPDWVGENSNYFITICTVSRSVNQLCNSDISDKLWESVLYRQEFLGYWYVHVFLLMPDHLHMIVSFSFRKTLKQTVTDWKSYTGKAFKVKWQRDFFEHRLRNDESLLNKSNYILMNPVRKGYVKNIDEWPFFWGFDIYGKFYNYKNYYES